VPYLANIDGLIVIMVVISIIVQVVKGAKKVKSAMPGQPARSPSGEQGRESGRDAHRTSVQTERNEELRKFLENLGLPVQEFAPQPAPPPVRRQPRPHRQAPARSTERITNAREKQVVISKPAPAAPPAPQTVEISRQQDKKNARDLRALLKKSGTQRQAIVLQEILGPPVSLRS
jgi:hypothetical protein